MGTTPFPADLILRIAEAYSVTAFVETGTYYGTTTAWASEHFETIHTIEVGKDRFKATAASLAHKKNITCHFGNSRTHLPRIVQMLQGWRVVYYLDGHWSGEGTDGESDQCPLLEELACLSNSDIIIIDDVRIFIEGALPPLDPEQWPTYPEVLAAIPVGMFVRVIGDVIFAVPYSVQDTLSSL